MYKKVFASVLVSALTLISVAGCSTPEASNTPKVIKVAASATPMTDAILAAATAIDDNYQIELVETSGYFTPNVALKNGEVDANFIQHRPHMEDFNEGNDADLTVVAPIYYVVGAFYSKNFSSLQDLQEGAKVVIPNDSNQGRALELLKDEGLLELNDEAQKFESTVADITSNVRNLNLVEVDLMNLNVAYDEADAVYNLGSFARQIGLFPEQDGLIMDFDEKFAVSLISRSDNLESPEIQALKEAFLSEEVRETLEGLDQKVAF